MKYLFVSSLSDIPPLASTCPNRRNEIGGTPPNPADGNDCIAFASNFLFHSSRYTPGTKSETANYYRIHFNFRTENLQYSELSVFPDSYTLQSLPALHSFPRPRPQTLLILLLRLCRPIFAAPTLLHFATPPFFRPATANGASALPALGVKVRWGALNSFA